MDEIIEKNTTDLTEISVIHRPLLDKIFFPLFSIVRKIVTALFLVLVFFATGLVMLFSWRVHKELSSITAMTTLRHHVDHILLDMVSLGIAERLFSTTQQEEHYQSFSQASDRLDRLLRNMAILGNSNPHWKEWIEEVKRSIEVRRNLVRQQVVEDIQTRGKQEHNVTDDNSTSPIPHKTLPSLTAEKTAAVQIIPNRLAELVATFLHAEEENFIRRKRNLEFLHVEILFAAIVALICAFGLLCILSHRFRQDVHRLRNYQNLLRSENVILEQRVKDRTSDLEAARSYAEKERQRVELLLQDASHRIGNSLAIVSSLLGLQLQRSKNDEVRSALISARDRIQTIATAHRRLRLGEDTETANIAPFLRSVVDDILSTIPIEQHERICFNTHFEDYYLASRDVTTLGIILGELLINAVKHAFPNNCKGEIFIRFGKTVNGVLELVIEDSVTDFTELKIEHNNANKIDSLRTNRTGLGKLVVLQLCKQFGAIPHFEQGLKGGTRVVIVLHKLFYLKYSLQQEKENRE